MAKPLTREEIAKQERNAPYPALLRVATFGVVLSGTLLLTSFIGSFVMFMNTREDAKQESVGTYRATSFYVLQTYWQKGALASGHNVDSPTRAFARGTVDGHQEWMDLIPILKFIPKDQQTVTRAFPEGTIIPVYYNPQLQGEYRVRPLSATLPAEANRHASSVIFRYGMLALLITGTMLFGCLRLRKFAIANSGTDGTVSIS